MFVREKCIIPDCHRFGRNKGLYKGQTRWDKVCSVHHGKGLQKAHFWNRRLIENKKCELCGYEKAPCDRHRIIPDLGYIKNNVVILCPNCHREVTLGLVVL